jgi:hypothetical protein
MWLPDLTAAAYCMYLTTTQSTICTVEHEEGERAGGIDENKAKRQRNTIYRIFSAPLFVL